MNAIIRQLAARDACRPGSAEWLIHNRTAWRLYLHETGGLLSDTTPPPSDFGLAYLQERIAA